MKCLLTHPDVVPYSLDTGVSISVEQDLGNQGLAAYRLAFPSRFVLPVLKPLLSHLHSY